MNKVCVIKIEKKILFSVEIFFFLEHIDNWYTITSRFREIPQGEIHLILDYTPLKV